LCRATTKKKCQETEKGELINKVNPRTDKTKIKGIEQTKAKSIVMAFETRNDLQKFKDHSKLESL
jgi:hypothetical protein